MPDMCEWVSDSGRYENQQNFRDARGGSTSLYYISLSLGFGNIDDWHRHPNINIRDHLVGRLTIMVSTYIFILYYHSHAVLYFSVTWIWKYRWLTNTSKYQYQRDHVVGRLTTPAPILTTSSIPSLLELHSNPILHQLLSVLSPVLPVVAQCTRLLSASWDVTWVESCHRLSFCCRP